MDSRCLAVAADGVSAPSTDSTPPGLLRSKKQGTAWLPAAAAETQGPDIPLADGFSPHRIFPLISRISVLCSACHFI